MMLHNPTDVEKEWRYDGESHILGPGEKDIFEGVVANHALKEDGLGIVKFISKDMQPEVVVVADNVDYNTLKWRDLVRIASDSGVFKPGMKKDEVLKALKEMDEQD